MQTRDLGAKAIRWFAAQLVLVAAGVVGLGFDLPLLTIFALGILLPTMFAAWWIRLARRLRQGEMFTPSARIPEISSWAVVIGLLVVGVTLAKPS